MALEPKSKEINGRMYTVTPLPALEALDVFELLAKLAGPGMAALADSGGSVDLARVSEAIVGKLGGGQLKMLTKELLKGASFELKGRNVDILTVMSIEYAGRLFELFKVLAFAIEVNFQDFFDGMRQLLGDKLALLADKSASTSPSA